MGVWVAEHIWHEYVDSFSALGTEIGCAWRKDVGVVGREICIFERPEGAFFEAQCWWIWFVGGGWADVAKGAVAQLEEEEE